MSPLRGVRVLELSGLAPAPFCGMVLADLGATVTRVDKAGSTTNMDVMARGKRSVVINLKNPYGARVLRKMCLGTDVLIEPFRRGVMERLNLGPDVLLAENPRLIYARLTGYGQSGSYADRAGHDINYLSLSGLLSRLGRQHEAPLPPINLLADFAGGGLTCALGILAALIDRGNTGKGQVIDANMVEGAAYVGSWIYKSQDMFIWGKGRGQNALDSGSHFYETYETSDGKFMAVGAIEPQFYSALLEGLGFSPEEAPQFGGGVDLLKEKFRERFLQKTRAEWTEVFERVDACVTPILELDEAPKFQHNEERGAFARDENGKLDPVPAPRLSNHTNLTEIVGRKNPSVGEHTFEVLEEAGFTKPEIEELLKSGIVELGERSKL